MGAYTAQILVLIICLILSAFFSMSETSIMSLSKIKIRHMLEDGVKEYEIIDKLLDNPSKLLGGILIGNNIANICASAIATSITIDAIGEGAVAMSTVMMTVLVLIFGEITPKTIAKYNPEKIALIVCRPIIIIIKVLSPFVLLFTTISNSFVLIFGGRNKDKEPIITEEELKTMVGVSEEEGILENIEKEFIFNVFDFADLRVKDVMIPRVDLVALEINSNYEDVIRIIKEENFSRVPVYEDNIDKIVGILNVKDLLIKSNENTNEEFNLKYYMREPNFISEYKKIKDLFNEMKSSRNHIAIVIDEYGGTVGLITFEDLIEEVVGEIEDEYDKLKDDEVIKINENEYLVDARINITDLSDRLNVRINSEKFDSIGGLIFGEMGRLPKKRDEITYNNIRFVVESVERNRVDKVRVFL